ncbi:MAG: leucine-rich repeat domain-containing protein, partial [Lachnospiraceae bacterium]|nr:leucine-rich repeat domain-containing protein [Lachnospiraceae bacterium]
KNVFEIYPDAFAGCTALTSVTMKKVQNISFSAFTGCISLKKITIPKTVKEIGNEAFDGCTSLSAITIQSATPTLLNAVGADAFDDISVNAYIKIQARPADKETIKTLLTEAGVDPTRIK